MNLGNSIRKVRELRNLTQQHMAIELGISQKQYSNIENSINNVTLVTLEKIATLLQVRVEQLISFNSEGLLSPPPPPIHHYKKAPSINLIIT